VSDAVEKAISQITQDIQASIRRHGIILTGCGAEYSVFSNLLREELGWPIHLSKHPRHDVILGMEKAIRLKHEGVAHSALKKI
jgi:actin-like ATPase involved in cell morphogenesis